MAVFRGADEVVVREIQRRRKRTERIGHPVGEVLRRDTGIGRRFFDLLTVFVGAC